MAATPQDEPDVEPAAGEGTDLPAQRAYRSRRRPDAGARTKADPQDEDEDDEGDEGEDEADEVEPLTYSGREVGRAVRDLWHFFKPHLASRRGPMALLVAGLLLETTFNVAFPLSLKYLLDEVLEEGELQTLVTILAVLGLFGLVVSVAAIAYERLNAQLCGAISSEIRHRLFAHLQHVSLAFYGRTQSGRVLSRFSGDMESVDDVLMHGADWGALPFFELIAAIGLLFFLSPPMALLALLIFPLTFVGPRLFAPRAIEASYDVRRSIAAEIGVVTENVAAQPVVRAFSLQQTSIGWFRARNDRVRHSIVRARFLDSLVERSISISVLLLHLIVFGTGAVLAFDGTISVGTFVAFEAVFWDLSYNISYVTQFIPTLIEGSGAVRHINELLDEPERASDPPDALPAPRLSHEIRFENAAFGYGAGGRQIEGLSWTIPAGSRVAVVGESGSGKSTLLALLMRLYEPDDGRITLDGVDLTRMSRASLREQMGVVFQDNVLFAATIRENIRLGRQGATDAEVEAAARQAEIHRYIMSLPGGYDTEVGERGNTLSGGQRQRLAIARALIRDPAILLLDEATSALDPATEASILKTLARVSRGRTLVTVTHRLRSVEDYDQIAVMQDGRIVEYGSHGELVKIKGAYARLRSRQGRAK
jgi:ATP-binding cassette subfamily B protein